MLAWGIAGSEGHPTSSFTAVKRCRRAILGRMTEGWSTTPACAATPGIRNGRVAIVKGKDGEAGIALEVGGIGELRVDVMLYN